MLKITGDILKGSRRKGNVSMNSYKLEDRREVYILETPTRSQKFGRFCVDGEMCASRRGDCWNPQSYVIWDRQHAEWQAASWLA